MLNLKGEAVTDVKYDIDYRFLHGLASFSLADTKFEDSFIYGLINTKGQVLAKPVYREILSFSNGLARVMVYKQDKVYKEYYPNYGYIDISGKEVVKPELARASESFSHGMAVIARFDDQDDGEFDHALINTKGEFKLGYNWKNLKILDSRYLLAKTIKNKYETILINSEGKRIMSVEDKGIADLNNGLYTVTNMDKEPVYFIGLDKKISIDLSQNKRRKFMSYQYGLIRFCNLDSNDKESVQVKLGLMDLKGNIIVKPKYNRIGDFELTDGSL
ncbi:hypothetical protein TH53_17615 [Pedobacter lusitanus]|uniref:WG repeat-containing protein n=1 Tax=Pedobacter lusitanus TaxID=1503925 RepID=A0A0D0GND8_9SPHI|nr:WG repeat-containing protein [Pedobacter lusitanus]KIO75986.1 hypothetical protein TH53_17615 [Pedobacter lusitanus]